MKRVLLFLILVIGCSLLASCEKETILSVDQTSITIPDTGGSQSVSLSTNKPWTASSNQSWCKVSPSSGEEASSSRITINCESNTTYDARNASITFTCAEKTVSVNVSQETNNGLLVSQTEYNITNAAQQLEIKVQANVKFSVEVDNGCKDWVKYNTTKGLPNSTVVLDIAKNEAYDGREGKVTIKQTDGNLSATVVIKQGQLDGLFLTSSEYNLSNEKHTLTVEVKSNIDFEVKPEVDWIKYVETKGLKTNQIILDVAENDTYDVREGKVTVKQKNGSLTGTITVKQEQNYGLILSQTEFDLGNDAQSIEVEVKYNVDFDVVIPSGCKDWIKQVSTKGLTSKTYTFSIAKNETYDSREGSITFKQKNGALSGTVSVKQSQNNGLFVTKSDYEINNESQTINVEVKANVDFEVKSESTWVKIVETKGLKTSTIVLSVEENDSYDTRNGRVTVTQKDGDLKGTINIEQNGKNGIVLTQTDYELTKEAQSLNVEVQTTVQIEVIISDSGKSWVSLVSTKALDPKTYSFAIKKNETYDNRQCTVTFKQKGGEMSNSITIRQAQTDYLEIEKTEYEVSEEEQTIGITVKSNIDYQLIIADSCKEWISEVTTKGLQSDLRTILVAYNHGGSRSGSVILEGPSIRKEIIIRQHAGVVEFDDVAFKSYCIKYFDSNKDGEISPAEANVVKTIEVETDNISSLKGVESFSNLVKLVCYGDTDHWDAVQGRDVPDGLLTNLDVSGLKALSYLDCNCNQLINLNVSGCTALTHLICSDCQLSNLDVSSCVALGTLDCNFNPLTNLNVSGCKSLKYLNCDDCQLKSLDVSSCVALETLYCNYNQLTSLNVSGCKSLNVLKCYSNELASLNVSSCTSLTYLACDGNQLTGIDVSCCTALTSLGCEGNQLTSLVIKNLPALAALGCNFNPLTSLDVSGCTALASLTCDETPLKSLNVSHTSLTKLLYSKLTNLESINASGCTALTYIGSFKSLTDLNVSGCTALRELYCSGYALTRLDVSSCTALEELSCKNNQLVSLSVSGCNSLTSIDCTNNRLISLDVSTNNKLARLYCKSNPSLTEIWLKEGQRISVFEYDKDVATIKYK